MRGFTDKALILLSKPDSFEECGSIYKYDYKVAVDNITTTLIVWAYRMTVSSQMVLPQI